MNDPNIVARGPTRADQIAKQMDVKTEENQQQRFEPLDARHPSDRDGDECAEYSMKKKVMIHGIPLAGRKSQHLIAKVHCQSEPIEIGGKPSEANPQSFAAIFSAAFRSDPTG